MLQERKSQKSDEKILQSAELVRAKGFDYIWIDTCCIDKSSSAELSETIDSMFAWYKNPETLDFGRSFGTRRSLKCEIQEIIKVAKIVLDDGSLDGVVAGIKMSWASGRNTTRPEGITYCPLGLFNVNMDLLYGESKERVFIRLQEGFLKNYDDESIFAWTAYEEDS
ncbi:hypothetical protein BGZ60DRAFT_435868 [Tricladium varicosporioides]|nr:hypothetical protein BGZ60DRAFT_435868 [Hymenoscyphus varicosporioides]